MMKFLVSRESWLLQLIAVFILYVLLALLGLSLASVAEQVSVVWPASGFALAAVLIFGYRITPAIFAGAWIGNLFANEPVLVAFGIGCSNCLESIVGAWLFRTLGGNIALSRLFDCSRLVLAITVSTLLGSLLGPLMLCLGGVQEWSEYLPLSWGWWLGDAMGDLIITPLLLVLFTWSVSERSLVSKSEMRESYILAGSLFGLTCVIFAGLIPHALRPLMQYSMFPFIIYMALQFGLLGTSIMLLLIDGLAIWTTLNQHGPFMADSLNASLTTLQSFMGVISLTGLVVSVASEERQRAQRTLLAVNKQKDEFIAMLAHELRNPLNAISTSLQLMKKRKSLPFPFNIEEIIQTQVGSLTCLINDLLDFSRISQGKILLRKEVFDLVPLIQARIATIEPLLKERSISLNVAFEWPSIMVRADKVRFEQVLVNLLMNALKFNNPKGEIKLDVKAEQENVILTVADSGIGIAPEVLPVIFEPFVQAKHSQHRSDSGLGVGLALAKMLVELHAGWIEANSAGLTKGSVFTVSLPIVVQVGTALSESAAVLSQPSSEVVVSSPIPIKILIVEDNHISAWNIKEYLDQSGFEVYIAHEGSSAIRMAQEHKPDIILMDIGLPEMNGYEVLKQLQRDKISESRCIAISGYGQQADKKRSSEAGFVDHLVKPLDLEVLITIVHKHCSSPDYRR